MMDFSLAIFIIIFLADFSNIFHTFDTSASTRFFLLIYGYCLLYIHIGSFDHMIMWS